MNVQRYACVWDWFQTEFRVFAVVGEKKDGYFVGNFDDRVKTLFNCGHYGSYPGIPMRWIAKTRKGAVGKQRTFHKEVLKERESELADAKSDLAKLETMYEALF